LAVEEQRIALQEEWISKEKKLEEQRIALEEETLAKKKEDADRTLIFMNPRILDEQARAYWELARANYKYKLSIILPRVPSG
jgi:hypothetical protein